MLSADGILLANHICMHVENFFWHNGNNFLVCVVSVCTHNFDYDHCCEQVTRMYITQAGLYLVFFLFICYLGIVNKLQKSAYQSLVDLRRNLQI